MKFPLQLQKINLANSVVELFVPEVSAVKQAYENGGMDFPYWSQVWPAAIALSEFIESHTHYVKQKKVLELGAGLGLPSIVAARYAASVLCTDYAEEAIEIVAKTADHHHFENFETAVVDWRNMPSNITADVLLLSDINYEPGAFEELSKMINHFLQAGTIIILSTPQRLMAKEFIAPMIGYCVKQEEREVVTSENLIRLSVIVLKQSN